MSSDYRSGLSLRKATTDDLPTLLRLYAQLDGSVLRLEAAQPVFERIHTNPCQTIYLVDEERVSVGTFSVLIRQNLGHQGSPFAVVEDLVVDAACRRQGIATWIMHQALQIAREAGCYKLALSSNLNRQEAHAFYEALGFKRHGYSFAVEL